MTRYHKVWASHLAAGILSRFPVTNKTHTAGGTSERSRGMMVSQCDHSRVMKYKLTITKCHRSSDRKHSSEFILQLQNTSDNW